MNTLHKQKGISLLGWMIIVSMAGVLFVAALKLFPLYSEYYKLVTILENMQQDAKLRGATKQVIATSFVKRLQIEQVKNLTKKDYTIKKVKGRKAYRIDINYEAKTDLFGNLALIATFSRSGEIGQ